MLALLVLLVFMFVICWFIGMLSTVVFTSGPAAVLFLGIFISLAMAYAAYRFFDSRFFAVLAALFTLLPSLGVLRHGSSEGKALKAMAPDVVQFGLDQFAALDTDNSGIISESEMMHGAGNRQFSSVERHYVEYMYAERSGIGHVTKVDYDWNPATETIDSTTYYGISKLDLQSYPRQLSERYKHW